MHMAEAMHYGRARCPSYVRELDRKAQEGPAAGSGLHDLDVGAGHDYLTAVGEARVAAAALESMARQPDLSGTITRTLFVSLAMIESTAIYCLLVSMLLLFKVGPLFKAAEAVTP